MEAEARAILAEAVTSPGERSLADLLLSLRDAAAGQALARPPSDQPARDRLA